MTAERKPVSTQEFVDQTMEHRSQRILALEKNLPPHISSLCEEVRTTTRQALRLKEEDVVVIFGEQAYGLNEPPKVVGKRVFAKGLEQKHGIVPLELFATYDIAGSEGGIYRMQIPHPNAPDGFTSINMLPGWKRRKNLATNAFRSPSPDELNKVFATIGGVYGNFKAQNLKTFMERHYTPQNNYALANMEILRDFERQIGLEIQHYTTEEILDTKIAVNGGMEVMLFLWPRIVAEAVNHPTQGVRVPDIQETPYHLYHQNGECGGRMYTRFTNNKNGFAMDTPVEAQCMHCGHNEMTTTENVLSQGRIITWRAVPRVIAYSTLGIADSHITGGGSIYNSTAKETATNTGVSYFPITHMEKRNGSGDKYGVFVYQSAALMKPSGKTYDQAQRFVKEGRAAMTDLVLSIGVEKLKLVITETLNTELTTGSRVICPEPIGKNEKVIT